MSGRSNCSVLKALLVGTWDWLLKNLASGCSPPGLATEKKLIFVDEYLIFGEPWLDN